MKFNVEIQSIKESDLPFLEEMFGASSEDWKKAVETETIIKPNLDFGPNDISHHINDLVHLGMEALKNKYSKSK